ncbi:MAG: M2 family metallopeptidase, partial [Sphingomonadaceae bacterium]
MKISFRAAASALALGVAAIPAAAIAAKDAAPTAAQADRFVAQAEKELFDLSIPSAQVAWVNSTYINDDTDALNTLFGAKNTEAAVRLAKEAAKYDKVVGLTPDTRRKLDILRQGIVLPAPSTEGAATELNALSTKMSSIYGKGRGTLDGKEINGSDIEEKMGTVRNPAQLKEMWTSWHDNVGKPMKGDYARMVQIANQGAKELGYKDLGAMWRSNYDMSPEEFAKLTDKLWLQVKPLYDQLHCYTRTKLNEKYGDKVQAKTGPIRADLLGNMWAQEWGNIYDVVAPKGTGDLGFDTTELLTAKGYDALKMVKAGEGFFSSLGFAPLPESFWKRSQFV